MRIILFIILSLAFFAAQAQQTDPVFDSINKALSLLPEDSHKVEELNKLCWDYRNSHPEIAQEYGLSAIKLAEKIPYNDELLKAMSFTGVTYRNLGNYPEALDYFFQHLQLAKKLNNLEQQGYGHINLGNIYIYQSKADEAVEELEQALVITKKLDNDKMSAYTMLNLGKAYMMKDDYQKAISYFDESANIRKHMDDPEGQGVSIKYKGDAFFGMKDYLMALNSYREALTLTDTTKDKDFYSDILNMMARVYLRRGDSQSAVEFGKMSFRIAIQVEAKLRVKESCQTLSEAYSELGEYEEAFRYQSLLIQYKDSIFNEEISGKIADIQFSAEREKKQAEIELLNQEKEIQKLEIDRQRYVNIGLGSIIALIALLGVVLVRSNIQRKKANRLLRLQKDQIEVKNTQLQEFNEAIKQQNEEITAQRDEIETQRDEIQQQRDQVIKQKHEITDSIVYARRIQMAILPPQDLIQRLLPDHFILYKPRDIVSGDFYWVTERNGYVIAALADCTGHGVPGAFMSMLGIASMNEIVSKLEDFRADTILNHLRDNIIKSLHQTIREARESVGMPYGSAVKDGMDMTLVVLNRETLTLQFAGANNPIYIVQNGEIVELKPDKMPIGIYVGAETPLFTNHEVNLNPGDAFYLLTDGFADQFGGPDSKKFKYKALKELILSMQDVPMILQKDVMDKAIEDWKAFPDPVSGGPHEQIDDISIMGVKVSANLE